MMLSSVLVRSRSVLSSVLVRSCSKLLVDGRSNNPKALFSCIGYDASRLSQLKEKKKEELLRLSDKEKVCELFCSSFDKEDAKSNYGQPCGNPEPFIFSEEDIKSDESVWNMYERWLRHTNRIMTARMKDRQFHSFKQNVIYTYQRHKADPSVPLVAGLYAHLAPHERYRRGHEKVYRIGPKEEGKDPEMTFNLLLRSARRAMDGPTC